MAIIDLGGQRFDKWLVVPGTCRIRKNAKSNTTFWRCVCDCGTEREVDAGSLRRGQSKNCGCGHPGRIHGGTGTLAYNSWNSMRQRCGKPGPYENVSICSQWLGSSGFITFLADMGERKPGSTLDRINSSGNYEPANCRWASRKTQTHNRKNTRLVIFDGRAVPFSVACSFMERRLKKGDRTYEITVLMPGSVVLPTRQP